MTSNMPGKVDVIKHTCMFPPICKRILLSEVRFFLPYRITKETMKDVKIDLVFVTAHIIIRKKEKISYNKTKTKPETSKQQEETK